MTGMTPLEHEIMDLWDAGKSVTQIDQCCGHKLSTIKAVVSRLHVSDREEQKARVDAVEQDGCFLDAMRKFHPMQVVS